METHLTQPLQTHSSSINSLNFPKTLSGSSLNPSDKKLKLVLKSRRILMSQPNKIMQLHDLGKFRRVLSLEKIRQFITLLRRFPAVFEIVEEGVYSLKFKLTPEAERLYLKEIKVKNEMEELQVVKLRKMLMMLAEKRILVKKLSHMKTNFGLPLDFEDTICWWYPQYFKVVSIGSGPALELTHWDPELAAELVEEENRERELEERNLIIDRPLKFNRVKLSSSFERRDENFSVQRHSIHFSIQFSISTRTCPL